MPRSFDMATDYAATVEQVHRALLEEKYWLARLAESGADETRLDAFELGRDGGIDVVTTQVLHAGRLPAVIQQFHHGDLEIRRAETWTAISDGAAQATVAGSIAGAPVSLICQGGLAPSDAAPDGLARMAFRATVDVQIPLVGRKLENFISHQLEQLLIDEQIFTTTWIAGKR